MTFQNIDLSSWDTLCMYVCIYSIYIYIPKFLRVGAGKSLAQPGRIHATTTKLGIYSTYSPWSSVHFLACCSNLCSDLRVGRKMSNFQSFFQSREQVVVRQGQIRRIGVGDQDIGSPGRPVSSGLQVPGALSYKNKTPLVTFPRHFSFKVSSNCTSRDEQYSMLIVWPFGI
jgi:hypothetical protein